MSHHSDQSTDQAGLAAAALVEPKQFSVGDGFDARSFKHAQFGGKMDPLIMVDHYVMTRPTFGPHGHSGMSAVSVLFEDSVGDFNNKDSLGNDLNLQPGDLFWLKAGAGALHDEKPLGDARIHGLQMFVNLPNARKHEAPEALHVSAADMPVLEGDGYRTRIVLGDSAGVYGAQALGVPMTILDIHLSRGGQVTHAARAGHSVWLYAVKGDIRLSLSGQTLTVPQGKALSFDASGQTGHMTIESITGAHAVLVQGEAIRENFVQQGPFVMDTMANLDKVKAAYEAGQFGAIG